MKVTSYDHPNSSHILSDKSVLNKKDLSKDHVSFSLREGINFSELEKSPINLEEAKNKLLSAPLETSLHKLSQTRVFGVLASQNTFMTNKEMASFREKMVKESVKNNNELALFNKEIEPQNLSILSQLLTKK